MSKNKTLVQQIVLNRLERCDCPEPVLEYRFHKKRKWRFDFAFLDEKIAIEYEGGVWGGGAHIRGKHFNSDSEKYNEAAMMGWTVLRYTVSSLKNLTRDMKRLF